ACGGAHPKHLANYTLRLHDYAELCTPKLSSAMKQAIIEACLAALLLANEKKISYWEDSFWRKRALVSLKQAAQKSNLHKQNGFEQALTLLQNNLNNFRQPRFQLPKEQANPLSFPAKVPVLQSLLIPYLAALLPLVYGEELGGKIMGTLWEARLLTQMRYATCLAVLEEHFGLEPEDGDLETSIGLIRFRNVCISCGNAEMMPWIIEVTPKPGLCNVRQALISFVRKHHADTALTLLRNLENGSLVLSRGLGIPKELWDSLVNWLIATEGSSDLEGEPGCWHVVTSALGTRADFILNGNAAHQYVPKSKLTVDLLAEWVRTHACN
ncbi:MAG: hypothetical protein IJS50_00435, partial [Desulfovibrio sp.]|nr:hypothetical protein [Desulfovibrio sp.]